MLNQYLTQTAQLLQNPAAPTPLYSTANLTQFINTARGQLAAESECIRLYTSQNLTVAARVFPFSGFTIPSGQGIEAPIKVNTLWYSVASGQKWITPRSFEWFGLYSLNHPVPASGQPARWAQYGQGVSGTIYIDPLPDNAYLVFADTVCYPIALATDSDVEAIPYLWTDAVPYFAAYLALLSSQGTARMQDAQRMFQLYEEFTNRARRFATPGLLPGNYPQNADPTMSAQLGQMAMARGRPGAG